MSRSRRCPTSSSTPSWRPRTRISTSTVASISPASRAPPSIYVEHYGSGRHPQGASTITQQVAKNFLLTNKVTFSRKIREALLALKIERAYSKDKILELYLNEIYLGMGSYGIAAAALTYFDKSINELTIAQAAYLAALPKGPNNYQPFRHPKRAIERRNWVIDQMAQDGFIKKADAEKAKKQPLGVVTNSVGPRRFSAEYFAEEVRRELAQRYGEKEALRGRAVGAHDTRSQVAGDGAPDPDARAGKL